MAARPAIPKSEYWLAAAAGAAATVLAAAGAALLIDLPGMEEPGEAVAEYAAGNRTRLLAAAVIWGGAATVLAAFAVGVHYAVRHRSPSLINDAGLAAALVLAAIQLSGWGMLLPLAFRTHPAETAQLLGDLVFLLLGLAGIPAALWTIAASHALARAGLARGWVVVLGYLSALAHVEAASALASSGPFSPSGPGAYISPLLISVWVVVVTLALAASAGGTLSLLRSVRPMLLPEDR